MRVVQVKPFKDYCGQSYKRN